LKIFVSNHSDISGGAARAAYRIHHALRGAGVDSRMWVSVAASGDWTVEGPPVKLLKAMAKLRPSIGGLFNRLFATANHILHSPAVLPSGWPKRINASDVDVVHLHWVNSEMMSIGDIGRIRKPVVWTLHDMWAFCGAEHYTEDFRWRDGYTPENRPGYESGFDLNRWTWHRKLRAWHRPIHIITPSRWLADCVGQSVLMRAWPVTVVPNAIDTDMWQPVAKPFARQLLHLPGDVPLLLFGAMGGAADPRKGFDLLRQALQHLHGQIKDLQLVVFGQLAPRMPEDIGFPIHYMGQLHDELTLRVLYSAVDMMVIPSRQDNLPNTGVESLTCGAPVVAFDTCGLPDIVHHQQTGYLAKPFDSEDLAQGIQWVISDRERYANLCESARQDAVTRFSYPVVAEKYQQVYETAIASPTS
jgi:glycosyltransferase involved in cell wall biosynthesis